MRQCVYCKVYNTTSNGLSFHRIPKDEAILNLWIQSMGYDLKWRPLKNHFLCSQHFSPECYTGKRLKKGSVPTRFERRILQIKIEVDIKDEVEDRVDNNGEFEGDNEVKANINDYVDKDTEDEINSSIELNRNYTSININRDRAIRSREVHKNKCDKINKNTEECSRTEYPSVCINKEDTNLEDDNGKEMDRSYERFKIKNEEVDLSDGECTTSVKEENISKEERREDVKRRKRKGDEWSKNSAAAAVTQQALRVCDKTKDSLYLQTNRKGVRRGKKVQLLINGQKVNNDVTVAQNKKPRSANIYKTSTKSKKVKNEVERKPKFKLFICDFCDKCYKRKSTIMEHMKKHTNNEKDYHKCLQCGYRTVHKALLSRHVLGKHTDKTFKCPHCDFIAKYISSISAHINANHTKTNIFKCSLCSYTSFRKNNLEVHINCKHSKTTFHFCPHCSFKTHFRSVIDKHINSKHTKTTSFSCTDCTFTSFQKDILTRHINTRHRKGSSFICDYCNYKTYMKDALARHINAKHTKNTCYKCPFCDFNTFGRTCINKHIRFRHEKKTEYLCPHCSYKTFNKDCLSRHSALHATDQLKNFKCPHCIYETPRNFDLTQHVNAMHSRSVSYSCSLCDFVTYYRQKLSKHVKRDH